MAGGAATEMDEFRAGANGDGPIDVAALNEWTVARRSGLGVREIITTWGQAADSFLTHAALVPEDEWASNRYAWVTGDISPALPPADAA